MKKVTGIIAEYNPFHRGHEYHIAESKRVTGADFCVVVMSGDFVQRGEPAILDKYSRAEMALRCGADLVIELPVAFATASAEKFAWGGVALLHSLGVIDTICCGCELDSDLIYTIAAVLAEEPASYRTVLRQKLREGISFPAAREAALLTYFQELQATGGHPVSASPAMVRDLISSPNAILALEYEKALRRLHSPVRLQLIERRGSYHAEDLPVADVHDMDTISKTQGPVGSPAVCPGSSLASEAAHSSAPAFASATAVRRFLLRQQTCLAQLDRNRDGIQALPKPVLTMLQRGAELMEKNDFSSMLGYALLMRRNGDLTQYQDVTPELANRILNHLTDYQNWEDFSELVKTKQVTKTHVDRALLHLLLGIQKETAESLSLIIPRYARILGFRTSAAPVLKEIKQCASVPILTKLADGEQTLQSWYAGDSSLRAAYTAASSQLQQDIAAADLYETARAAKYAVRKRNEYRQEIIRIE